MESLSARAGANGIEAIALSPRCGDFNEDLRGFGIDALRASPAGATRPGGRSALHGVLTRRRYGTTNAVSPHSLAPDSQAFPGVSERTAPRPSERATLRQAVRPRNGGSRLFSVASSRTLYIAKQNSRLPPSSARFGRFRGAGPVRPPPFVATKAAMGAAVPTKENAMTTDRDEQTYDPPLTTSPTDHVLTELQLHGYRPFQDEPDPRPLPEARTVADAVADIFDALIATLSETRLEPDLENLLWGSVNLFHRATMRIERDLDGNELAQKRSQKDQDGSEIRSVELERLIAEGMTLIERRNTIEFFRDQAAEQFERHTGSAWRPRSGSLVNHRTLTSAMIDSRDFLAAKRRVSP